MQTQQLTVGSSTVHVEVVSTLAQMAKGLADRVLLSKDDGMLFIYDEPIIPSFWMKGMRFPLDIVWLKDSRVVGIEHRVPADNGAVHYSPRVSVNAVLELNAGSVERYSLKPGDLVEYQR
ncbi:DUF192 domain-containing protein [Candidatus Berkelbacteria bacterium]|nr:DUF192 domain-containing protein [Candidatus Berkelbacteria bacterium]